MLGADGPTGAGAGEAVGRGATDVTAEWGDATLGALIVSLGGAFLAPVTRFGFAFSALTFVARPAVVFVAGFLAFVACLAGCFAAAALPVFQLAAATGLTGCLAAVLRPSFFVAFGVMYEKEHSAMQLHRLPCSIEAEARHCARREFTSARRNRLARRRQAPARDHADLDCDRSEARSPRSREADELYTSLAVFEKVALWPRHQLNID